MTDRPTRPQPSSDWEWPVLIGGLVLLAVAEIGRRGVWLAFADVSGTTSDSITGRNVPETGSLSRLLLIGAVLTILLAVGSAIAQRTSAQSSTIRAAAGAALAITGGALVLVGLRVASALTIDHPSVADGLPSGSILFLVASAGAALAGLFVLITNLTSAVRAPAIGASLAALAIIGILAPVPKPDTMPDVQDGFAFFARQGGDTQTGAPMADTNPVGRNVLVVDGSVTMVGTRFWEFEQGRVFRVFDINEAGGGGTLMDLAVTSEMLIAEVVDDSNDEFSLVSMSAADYTVLGIVTLDDYRLAGVDDDGTLFLSGLADGQRTVYAVDLAATLEAGRVPSPTPLISVESPVVAIDSRNGDQAFLTDDRLSFGLWRDGERTPVLGEDALCPGADLPTGEDMISANANFDEVGRVLIAFETFDATTQSRNTTLYILDVDGSLRRAAVPIARTQDIHAQDGRVFLHGTETLEILDYERFVEAAVPVASPALGCQIVGS